MEVDQILGLFFRERPTLEAYLFGATRDYQATQDILQEVALAITRKYRSYDPQLPFRPWLNGFTRLELASWLKSRGTGLRLLGPETLEACMPAFEEAMEDEGVGSRRRALGDCLSSVPEESRRAIALRYADHRSCEQIAQTLGRSVQGVYALIKRVKSLLKDCVELRLREIGT